MPEWDDLADDELRARLIHRLREHSRDPLTVAEHMVAFREEDSVASAITEILDG